MSVKSQSVFINAPFDRGYEPLFVTLVGTLLFLGQEPHCVLEIRETGQGRLARLHELLRHCQLSIHDLSRVGTPVRFNMPFELGIACGIALTYGGHEIVVLDSKPYRLDKTLSDYKGRDPLIHHNRCDELVTCLLDLFVSTQPLPSASQLRQANRLLRSTVKELKSELGIESIFRRSAYKTLVSAATAIGERRGFIRA